MAARNSKTRRVSLSTGTMGVASLIVCVLVVIMAYFLFDMRCASVKKEIQGLERELVNEEIKYAQAKADWGALVTPESLRQRLRTLGMVSVKEAQVVRIDRDGRIAPRQEKKVADIRRRSQAVESMAAVSTPAAAAETRMAVAGKMPRARSARR